MILRNVLIWAGLALLAGCSPSPQAPLAEPVALVSVAAVTRADLPEIVTGYGAVEFDPAGLRTLNAEIEARVIEIKAAPGESVVRGQTILRLAPSAAAGVDMTRARRDADTARAAADRTARLRTDGLASDADVESAETAARDQMELARSLDVRAGDVRSLTAPRDGMLDAVLVGPGDLVAPGAVLARIASPGAVQARISIEIDEAARLQIGDSVRLNAMDQSGAALETKVRIIDSRIDPSTRMAAALVTLPPGQGFLSGEAIRAEMILDIRTRVLAVPRQAVFSDETGSYVFAVNGDAALLVRVTTGLTSGDQTEIVSGLTEGQTVIVDGAAIVSDGMKITTGSTQPGAGQ